MTSSDKKRSALREPMVWLVVLLPTIVVIACIYTIMIASKGGGSDAIPDAVKRTAQIQTVDRTPEAYAKAEGLSVVLSVTDEQITVVPVTGQFDHSQGLRMLFEHPTDGHQDVALTLKSSEQQWHVDHALALSHDWKVHVSNPDGTWRLHGRLIKGERALRIAAKP